MVSRRRASRGVVPSADDRWSPEEAAEFAALRDFRLLQLLASDRRAFAVARQLGVFGASPPRARTAAEGRTNKPPQGDESVQPRGAAALSTALCAVGCVHLSLSLII